MTTSDLWATRARAIEHLEGPMRHAHAIIANLFWVLDEAINRFNLRRERAHSPLVLGLLASKSRRLLLASYSLILDGIGQESGALLRPTIECLELFIYFNRDPARISQIADGTLPSAGKIAQLIDGNLKGLREHLNRHASHVSLTEQSVGHLLEGDQLRLQSMPRFQAHQFERNLGDWSLFLQLITVQAVIGLDLVDPGCAFDLATRVDENTALMSEAFNLEALRELYAKAQRDPNEVA